MEQGLAELKSSGHRIWRQISGWGLLFLGVIGLFLPFLQGILFIILGLSILSTDYPWAGNILQKIKAKLKFRSSGNSDLDPRDGGP